MSNSHLKVSAFVLLTMFSASLLAAPTPVPKTAGEECTFANYSSKQVDQKVRILAKPEPEYSQEDRRQHPYGVIILTTVFCGSGKVTDIKVKQGLSDSLNERAVAAARKIRFVPAEKDGQKVSQVLTVEYHVKL